MHRLALNLGRLIRSAVNGFIEDNALSRAAAMAFYAATSLAPVILIVIAIAGIAVGDEAARLAVSAQLSGLLGPQGADLLEAILKGAADSSSGILAASIAVVTLIASASGVFGEMQQSLNQIWKVQPRSSSFFSLVRARAASLGLVGALGFLLLVSLSASAAISALGEYINARLPFGAAVLSVVNTLVSVTLLATLFGAVYKVLPDRSLAWRDVGIGAWLTAILFTVGKALIGWYLGTSTVASSYGAAGSLIALLLWVFYSSAIFLLGAELTRAFAVTFGTRGDLKPLTEQPASDRAVPAAPAAPVRAQEAVPVAAAPVRAGEAATIVASVAVVAALAATIAARLSAQPRPTARQPAPRRGPWRS